MDLSNKSDIDLLALQETMERELRFQRDELTRVKLQKGLIEERIAQLKEDRTKVAEEVATR